jgi:hypothetical protein
MGKVLSSAYKLKHSIEDEKPGIPDGICALFFPSIKLKYKVPSMTYLFYVRNLHRAQYSELNFNTTLL